MPTATGHCRSRRKDSAAYLLRIYLLFTLMSGSTMVLGQAKPLSFSSAESQTSLLELYTSQGCYSCPPAEHWLNQLSEHPQLWQNIVPLALHVDYWDYLGWKDPFANKRNQQRHYAYKFQGLTRGIYTPEMILNGRDWSAWRKKGRDPSRINFPAGEKVGVLELTVDPHTQQTQLFFSASESGKNAHDNLQANIALVAFGINMAINAGENKGKKLRHEFVVIAQQSSAAGALGTAKNTTQQATQQTPPAMYRWQFDNLAYAGAHQDAFGRLAIVAWLNAVDNNTPIQAVGGWLPEEFKQLSLPADKSDRIAAH